MKNLMVCFTMQQQQQEQEEEEDAAVAVLDNFAAENK